jgi:hypothetical protein
VCGIAAAHTGGAGGEEFDITAKLEMRATT